MANKKTSLAFVSFLQASGLAVYCSLVALFLQKANDWFGKMDNLFASTLFLVIFVLSALICAAIAFGYPFVLFWEKKQTMRAAKLVAYTVAWLTLFTLVATSALAILS